MAPPPASNDTKYDINILTGIAISGLLIKMAFYQNTSQDGVDGPANSVIWGYGVVLIALFGIMYITFSLASKSEMESNVVDFIQTMIFSSFPVLFLIGIIAWIIFMNITYKTRINKGQVSKDYYMFSTISSFLIVLQIIIILYYIRNQVGDNSTNNPNSMMPAIFKQVATQMSSISYAIGSVNYLIIFVLQIILKYFSTDG